MHSFMSETYIDDVLLHAHETLQDLGVEGCNKHSKEYKIKKLQYIKMIKIFSQGEQNEYCE